MEIWRYFTAVKTSSAEYAYDIAGRKTTETVHYGGFTKTYSYDYYKNGTKKSMTHPGGAVYQYTYNGANQLTGITIPGKGTITYSGYCYNSPSAVIFPGGSKLGYTYDALNRVTSITAQDQGQNTLMNYQYQYDAMGNITAKSTEHGSYAYQYDDMYQLTGAVITNPEGVAISSESFTYDTVGNRSNWEHNANNELLNADNATYQYDANGNTIQKLENNTTTYYTYDNENRLVEVTLNTEQGTKNCRYYYDPFGRRLSKCVNGTTTYFLYSDEGLIAEMDASVTITKTYGYTPDSTWGTNPIFQQEGGDYYFQQNDHLGTPQKLASSSGGIAWAATYDAFGKSTIDQHSTVENNLRFPGQYFDSETGLHYNWNRMYSADAGRYVSEDPIGFEGGDYNLYVYVSNNVNSFIDPYGLFGLPLPYPNPLPQTGVCDFKPKIECNELAFEIDKLLKGCDSLMKRIGQHRKMIDDCLKNPNPDCLRAINHWLGEIDAFRKQIRDKIERVEKLRSRMRELGCPNMP